MVDRNFCPFVCSILVFLVLFSLRPNHRRFLSIFWSEVADVPEPEVAAGPAFRSGGLIPPSEPPKAEGVVGGGQASVTPSGPLRRKHQRPSFLPIENHARPSEGGVLRPTPPRCCMLPHTPSQPHHQGAIPPLPSSPPLSPSHACL